MRYSNCCFFLKKGYLTMRVQKNLCGKLWKGADIVGGMPAAEMDRFICNKHVDLVFEIAKKYNA